MLNKPKITLVYNIKNVSQWVGKGWEFFDNDFDARVKFNVLTAQGHTVTVRPFHKNDVQHMGAAHWHLIKDIEKEDNNNVNK